MATQISNNQNDSSGPTKGGSEDILPSFSRSFLSFLTELVKIVLIAIAIIVPVRYFLIQPFYVKGASMEPNFHDNEYLVVDQLSYRFRAPHRGEVVVLKNPNGAKDFYIKRIIGLPNERLVIRSGHIIVFNADSPNGAQLDESSYLSDQVPTFGDVDVTLGAREFYIMGDNRPASLDSRTFGPVPRADIVGRTWIRAWPVSNFRLFTAPNYRLIPTT